MPVYKAIILNKEVSLKYEVNQKEKLEKAINEINRKLQNFDNYNGKISDNKLLSFLAIQLQAEIFDLIENSKSNKLFEKKIENSNNENIKLVQKIEHLNEKNNLLEKEKELISNDLIKIQKQIDIMLELFKNYEK